MTLGEYIANYRSVHGLSQRTFASNCGVSNAYISMLEKGENPKTQEPITPSFLQLRKIASGMGMSVQDLLLNVDETYIDISGYPPNIFPTPRTTKVPLIGDIACGVPILAEQNIEEMVDLPEQIKADFALRCKGESMVNAGIRDGDIVYIKEQEEVANGKIAAVMVGDEEATLKRFRRDGDVVVLIPENPAYETKTFVGEELQQLRILGLAVGYTHAFE